jgi:hypothetical protein
VTGDPDHVSIRALTVKTPSGWTDRSSGRD